LGDAIWSHFRQKEGVLEEQRDDTQLTVELFEDLLGVVGAVLVAHAGVVAAHDKVCAPVILAIGGKADLQRRMSVLPGDETIRGMPLSGQEPGELSTASMYARTVFGDRLLARKPRPHDEALAFRSGEVPM
jgi:hypothetical protein